MMNTRTTGALAAAFAASACMMLVAPGCSDDDAAVPAAHSDAGPDTALEEPIERAAKLTYHEHEFAQDEQLAADPSSTLIVHLEHADEDSPHPLDSGGEAGVDHIPIRHVQEETHEYCWPGDHGIHAPHVMAITLETGEELARVEEGGDCVTVTVPVGTHRLVLRHGGGRDGEPETIFFRPAPTDGNDGAGPNAGGSGDPAQPSGAMKPMSGGRTPTCSYARPATRATLNLEAGEVAVFADANLADSSSAWVFDGNCDDLSSFLSSAAFVATGPDTMAMVYRSAQFAGAMTRVNSSSANAPMPLSGARVRESDAEYSNAKGSLRVWTNTDPSKACNVSRAGLVADSQTVAGINPSAADVVARRGRDEIGALKPGEIALYSKPNFQGFAVVFSGPCANLNTICFAGQDSHARSLKLAANMVATVYADSSFGGFNWAYNADVPAFSDDTVWQSVWVETLTSYNTRKTLISTKNCTGCMLQSAQLQNAYLPGAVLTNADLRGADLTAAVLTGAKLQNAKLQGARANDVNLQNAVASSASFRGAFLNGANFKGAQLDGAFFNADPPYAAAHLNYAYLPNANLKNASLDGASMAYVDLYGTSATIEGATMRGTDLTGAILSDLVFGQVHLEGALLSGAVLINAKVQGAHLDGAKLIGAHLEGANFDGASLSGADLTHAVVAFQPGTYSVQVLSGDGTQTTVSVPYTYGATSLPGSITDDKTICPIGYPGPCNSDQSKTVDTTNRPDQPKCVPPPGQFCPRRQASQ